MLQSRMAIMIRSPLASFAFVALACLAGCGSHKQYVRDTQDPNIDREAMGTGLDKDDIRRRLSQDLNGLRTARIMNEWRSAPQRPTVAVFPFINETSEHMESQLQAILSESEQWLVESGVVTVISRERQNQMIA